MNAIQCSVPACRPATATHPFPPAALPPRPERLPRDARRIRDGLWSAPRITRDDRGREFAAMTHADGHSIVWPVRFTASAVLVDPDGHIVNTPAACREAHAFAFHWHAASPRTP